MPAQNRKISLIVFVIATLLLVGLLPLVLTGWLPFIPAINTVPCGRWSTVNLKCCGER